MAAEVELAGQVLRGKARSWKDLNDAFDPASFSKEALRARNLRFGNINTKCADDQVLLREMSIQRTTSARAQGGASLDSSVIGFGR